MHLVPNAGIVCLSVCNVAVFRGHTVYAAIFRK